MLSAHSDRAVTAKEKATCRMKFDAIEAVHGYDEAVRRIGLEYATGHKLAVWQAVQMGESPPPATGSAAQAEPPSAEAKRRGEQYRRSGRPRKGKA